MPIKESYVSVEPALEPFDLTEAKVHLEMTGTTDKDSMIQTLITAARVWVENYTGRSLITQTRVLKLDYFPISETIELPNGKVQSITHVKYYDSDEVEQTLSTADYWTDLTSNIARIVIKNYWPSVKDRPNAVTITYVCGYGSLATSVPKPIVGAIKMILAHLFENREQNSSVNLHEVPFGVYEILGPYVIVQDAFY